MQYLSGVCVCAIYCVFTTVLAVNMLWIHEQHFHSTHKALCIYLFISVNMKFAVVFFAARMSWSVVNGLFWCIDWWILFWQCMKLELIPAYLFGLVQAS